MTLKDIAKELGAPESTLRLYRDEFAEFIPATGEGRRRRYDAPAAETLRVILVGKKAGASGATIRQGLARSSEPRERKRAVTQEDRDAQLLVVIEAQGGEIALLRAEVGALRSEIGRLVTTLAAQRSGGKTMETIQREWLKR